jgi:hypothetical protein
MEQLMNEVAAFAAVMGIKPATVLQNAAGLSGHTWRKWEEGGSCSVNTAEKIRLHIAERMQTKEGAA